MYLIYDPERHSCDGRFYLQNCGGVPTLAEMQEVVGGLIEAVDLWVDDAGRVSMYVNEEGLYLCEPEVMVQWPNWYKISGNPPVFNGPFVIVRCDWNGDTVSLTEEDQNLLRFGRQSIISFTYGKMIPILEVLRG